MNFAIRLRCIQTGHRHWKDRFLDLLLPWEGRDSRRLAKGKRKNSPMVDLRGRDFFFFPFVRVLPELPIGNLLGTILAGGNGKPPAFRSQHESL
jgi:hypothetical protein